jgi:hypothetical protein
MEKIHEQTNSLRVTGVLWGRHHPEAPYTNSGMAQTAEVKKRTWDKTGCPRTLKLCSFLALTCILKFSSNDIE